MRKLVTLRRIGALNPIPDADAIEVASIDGWKVVVKKGQFNVGDWVVYFEIDSVLPKGREEFDFLMARGCKEHHCEDGTTLEGHRLRTIKLRGQVSQGLVIPVPSDWDIYTDQSSGTTYVKTSLREEAFDISDDFSELFGVKKYEKIIPASLAGVVRGNYPEWLPKTDQERIQNCFGKIDLHGTKWTIEEKLEGSSMTIYWDGEKAGVTSRNLDLSLDQEGNTFVDVAKQSQLMEALEWIAGEYPEKAGKIAIRGELIGPGIQDNIYGLSTHQFHIFDIYAVDNYVTFQAREAIVAMLMGRFPDAPWDTVVFSVPVIQNEAAFVTNVTVEEIIQMADGQSMLAPVNREGLVFKAVTPDRHGRIVSFKAISEKYLLKQKD